MVAFKERSFECSLVDLNVFNRCLIVCGCLADPELLMDDFFCPVFDGEDKHC